MRFVLNGKSIDYHGDPEARLLDYLRLECNLTSVKKGCNYEGACGCCTVQLNDKTILSCSTKMKVVANGTLTTVEGIASRMQAVLADAFAEKGGVQCGYCTPGIIMEAKVLLERNPDPTADDVRKALRRNLCRCTGYQKIIDSILLAARVLREGGQVQADDRTGKVGMRFRKVNSRLAAMGKLTFVDDIRCPGTKHAALKFSDHPRAKILSIDTSAALHLKGVIRVFTFEDIPGNPTLGLIVPDWPLLRKIREETRYLGDVLAGVVAETEAIARAAVSLIRIDYQILPPLTDPFEAMQPDRPKIHAGGNVLSRTNISRGDTQAALAGSAYVAKGRFTTQRVEHAFLEPESCFAEPWERDGQPGIRVFSQGQGAYEDRRQIAKLLALPEDRVNVIQVQTGGGFGGKEDLSVQGHTALFAYLLKCPVKLTLNRDESMVLHPKRHPFVMDYEVGCDHAGKLTAVKASLVCDTGAYASVGMKVLERAVGHATGAYHVPAVEVRGTCVYTNNLPSGAMRGFGVNQANFAMESCIDDLCRQGGFDRWQFRFDNALDEGKQTATGQVLKKGVGIRATLLSVKDDFYNAKCAGIACGIKNTGIGNGMADIGRCRIDIVSGQKIVLHHGWTEMGQGVHTMALQTLCEETGIDPAFIEVRVDTHAEAVCGMTTASRATSLVGNSIIAACRELKSDLRERGLEALAGKTYVGEWVCDWTTEPGSTPPEREITHYSYGYATQVVTLDEKGKISKVFAAHDAGRIMNPTLFEGQVEGGVHMGLGYALTEELPMKDGRPLSLKFSKCGVLRSYQMPDVIVRGVEVTDPHGPYGAKGVGEIGLVPTAPAVANALFQFDGKRRYSLPIKDVQPLMR